VANKKEASDGIVLAKNAYEGWYVDLSQAGVHCTTVVRTKVVMKVFKTSSLLVLLQRSQGF
jgi:hypothetical protein